MLKLHFGLQGGLQGLGRLQEGREEGFSIKVPTNSSPGHSPVTKHRFHAQSKHTAELKGPGPKRTPALSDDSPKT